MLSPRTASYIAALNREGENFDYGKWLEQVREEEVRAKRVPVAFASGEPLALEIGKPPSTPDRLKALETVGYRSFRSTGRVPAARQDRQVRTVSPDDRLRRRLLKIRIAWEEFQKTRARDAVYGYLKAIFAIVVRYQTRRRINGLLRQSFRTAGLRFDKNADPFAAVIRCTCGPRLDSKTVSKWVRALRYVAQCRVPGSQLKAFMKEAGGVNACVDLYARHFGRARYNFP